MSELITVEVVYATHGKQKLCNIKVPAGTTAQEAIQKSGILSEFPEIDLSTQKNWHFCQSSQTRYRFARQRSR